MEVIVILILFATIITVAYLWARPTRRDRYTQENFQRAVMRALKSGRLATKFSGEIATRR